MPLCTRRRGGRLCFILFFFVDTHPPCIPHSQAVEDQIKLLDVQKQLEQAHPGKLFVDLPLADTVFEVGALACALATSGACDLCGVLNSRPVLPSR